MYPTSQRILGDSGWKSSLIHEILFALNCITLWHVVRYNESFSFSPGGKAPIEKTRRRFDYRAHVPTDDESNLLLHTGSVPAKTTWTALLYLTSPATGCSGGETVFYPDDLPGKKNVLEKEIVVGLETGMLLLHKHGNDCMLHEGREVLDGEKWVIRTDLCVKRNR